MRVRQRRSDRRVNHHLNRLHRKAAAINTTGYTASLEPADKYSSNLLSCARLPLELPSICTRSCETPKNRVYHAAMDLLRTNSTSSTCTTAACQQLANQIKSSLAAIPNAND